MSKRPKKPSAKETAIAEAIAKCADANGSIEPKAVVKAARDPTNILHHEFEWDGPTLIQQALERRASELIRQCRNITVISERVLVFPMYVSDVNSSVKSYIPTMSVAKNDTVKRQTFERELQRLSGSVVRIRALSFVFGLQDRFAQVLDDLVKIEEEFRKLYE